MNRDGRYALFGLLTLTVVFLIGATMDSSLSVGLRASESRPSIYGANRCNENVTFSQFAQDQYLMKNLFSKKQTGMYIELGAYHPFRFSNTALMDTCVGWRGVCIDMNPFHKEEFEKQRTCEFVHTCVGNRSFLDYYLQDDALGDGKEGVLRVACQSFAAVLDKVRWLDHVDFLSVDVEGGELEALQTFPFERIQVEAILVETWRVGKEAVFDFLEDRGYVHKAELGPDDLFVWGGEQPWLPSQTKEWRTAVRAERKKSA